MQIFVTGGSGYIGRVVVAELVGRDHAVTGLARSEDSAAALSDLGAATVAGDLWSADEWGPAARAADAVIHLAMDLKSPAEGDAAAFDAVLGPPHTGQRGFDTAAGPAFVYTSGLWVVGDTGGATVGDDADTSHPAELVAWRVPSENRVLGAAAAGRTAAVVRPGSVYGRGGGASARMFATAVKSGAAEYVGDGENRWSSIHVDDLARLFALVVETGATGPINAVDGHPERVAEIAEAASRTAGAEGRTNPLPLEQVRQKLGAYADALCLDIGADAPAARALGWVPSRESFTACADAAFSEWAATRG
ncbi:MAG: NAD-dependent epimerase/dehydratase family protein [Gemmatimonadota bacterium]|nr:NAD-dependent epimerase/dehydratase family protein [Gemmatimonadota bacterium]